MFEIVFMEDNHNCETCGSDYALGYVIKKDGEIVIDKTPVAACYDGAKYDQNEAYIDLIRLHDIEVNVSHEVINEYEYRFEDEYNV